MYYIYIYTYKYIILLLFFISMQFYFKNRTQHIYELAPFRTKSFLFHELYSIYKFNSILLLYEYIDHLINIG